MVMRMRTMSTRLTAKAITVSNLFTALSENSDIKYGERNPGSKSLYSESDRDAFRHAYSAAMLTAQYLHAPVVVTMLGDLRELGGYDGTKIEVLSEEQRKDLKNALMDLHNNRVGVEIAKELGSSATDDDLADATQKAIDEGLLIIDHKDDRLGKYIEAIKKRESTGQEDGFLARLKRRKDFLGIVDEKFRDIMGISQTGLFNKIRELFNQALQSPYNNDPLALDLDGDGLETVSFNAGSVLFDHNGDGIRQGTGWLSGDDGFLAFDRNGDGRINDGSELFGDQTLKYDGSGKCQNGFEALAQEDTNGDGVVNHLDDNWINLRVWRDLNQNGLADEGELFTPEELGIAGLNLGRQAAAETGPGGQVTALGNYIKADGSVGQMGNLNFEADNFYREFVDKLEIPEELQDIPDLAAAGWARDLREAAVLRPELAELARQFCSLGTLERRAMMEELLAVWAASSGRATLEERAGQDYIIRFDRLAHTYRRNHVIDPKLAATGSDADNPGLSQEYRDYAAAWQKRLHVLEVFNGSRFLGPVNAND